MRALPVLLALVACHHDGAGPAAPVSTADQDGLWKLAPEGAVFGMVVSPRGVAMLDHAWADVRGFMATEPELAGTLAKLGKDPSLAGFGLTATKGGAVFMTASDDGVLIVPIGDRDAFLAAVHGTKGDPVDTLDKDMSCKTLQGMYVCASKPALFDGIGKGNLTAALAGARGDIELAGHDLPADGLTISFGAVAQLARGAITLRGTVAGLPKDKLALLGAASQPRLAGDRTTGFAIAHLASLLVPELGDEGDELLVDGVKTHDVWASIADPVTAAMQATSVDVRIPLKDPAPIRKAVFEHCKDGPLGELGATLVGNHCRIAPPRLANAPIDFTLDGNALDVAWATGAPGPAVEPTALGKELAATPWQLALYGRGSLLGAGALFSQQPLLQLLPADAKSVVHIAIRALALLDEEALAVRVDGDQLRIVAGLRTAWSNPDDVVAKLLALDSDAVFSGHGDAAIKSIVDAAPSSPFAADMRAGYGGMLVEVMAVGAMAAIAIPAFESYMHRAKHNEAEIELNVIAKQLKRGFGETGAYPTGRSQLLPAGPCCGKPDNKCAADPDAFAKDPIWKQLELAPDEPTQYQFRYQSADGKTATVEAIGDVDCDGTPATYTLRMSVTGAGNPQAEIQAPPAGVY